MMQTKTRDQDGFVVTPNVRRESDGTWGVTVWWGGMYDFATDVRRYYYRSRECARNASISDTIGERGRVG